MGGLYFIYPFLCPWTGASQVALVVKNPPANAGDIRDESSIPRSRRSSGGGHSNPLKCSCLENPTDREAWWATVHEVAKSWTRLKQLSSTHILSMDTGFTGVQISLRVSVFHSFRCMSRNGIAGSSDNSTFNFFEELSY